MKNVNIMKRISAGVLALILTAGFVPADVYEAARINHGTTNKVITEDMLSNVPPADYKIDEATQGKAENGDYNKYFLEEDIQTVKITIDENNLNYVLQNAIDEPYVMAKSVTIGDATLGYVGFKTKGNYTLQHAFTDNPGSDRFSFTINFGKYIKKADYGKKQDFFGCNKISFNNFFFDKTMMKEFFSLKLMDEMGLPTPQYGIAKLYINDQYYGVYAMVEAFDESILEQYYGVDDDELSSYLCKPTGTNFVYRTIMENPEPLWENDEDTYKDVEDMIPTVKEWVRKINCLSEGIDFEGNKLDVNSDKYVELLNQVYDVDEVLRYFATHSWLCQMDNMFDGNQNFGLYVDKQGKAMILPWDYDLSFGCYFPSTAEATANFDVDVMWRNGLWGRPMTPKEFYKNFPLFNVIYQNDSLMEKYHGYMKECSQIAALGGKLASTGKTYEPAYFNSYIEAMKEELTAAAAEKLASNVYYMNRINQPTDVKMGLPNLSRIIAMRAVGVYAQVEGMDTIVSGEGCNLETLGNAIWGDSSRNGNITCVDEKTGIFITADYARNNKAPDVNLTKIEAHETAYTTIIDEIGCSKNALTLYSIKNAVKPTGAYTFTIPVSQDAIDSGKTYTIYACTADGTATKLEATVKDNFYIVEVDQAKYIAIVEGGFLSGILGGDAPGWVIPAVIAAVVAVAAIVAVVVIRKKKAAKPASENE